MFVMTPSLTPAMRDLIAALARKAAADYLTRQTAPQCEKASVRTKRAALQRSNKAA